MLSFITQRIAKGVIVLLAIIVLNFFLIGSRRAIRHRDGR